MDAGEPVEHALAAGAQPDEDLPAIGGAAVPRDQAGLLQAVDQLHRAVVPEEEPAGQLADGGRPLAGGANGEQELVLPGL